MSHTSLRSGPRCERPWAVVSLELHHSTLRPEEPGSWGALTLPEASQECRAPADDPEERGASRPGLGMWCEPPSTAGNLQRQKREAAAGISSFLDPQGQGEGKEQSRGPEALTWGQVLALCL